MSLVKVAFNPVPFIAPGVSAFMAKSGDPLKYLTRKAKNHRFTKFLQNSTLAGLANIESEIRKGNVADATKIHSSIAESFMGQFGAMGANAIQDLHHTKGMKGLLINGPSQEMLAKLPTKLRNKIEFKGLLNEAIDNEGKYNIGNIEHRLNQFKELHNYGEKINKVPVTALGLVGGGVVGYSNEENGHKLKGALRGATKGAILGGSLRTGMNAIRNHELYKSIPKVHTAYFEDNYWRNALESANTGFYRKIGQGLGHTLTSPPGKRLARIDVHNAFSDLKDVNWNQPREFYQKAKIFGSAAKDSFRSKDYLKQKYGVQ